MKYELTLSDGSKVVMSPGPGKTINESIDASGLDVSSFAGVADDYTPEPTVPEKLNRVTDTYNELRQEPIDGFPADDLTLTLALAKLSRMGDSDTATWTKTDGSVHDLTKAQLADLIDQFIARTEVIKAESLMVAGAVSGGPAVDNALLVKYGVA